LESRVEVVTPIIDKDMRQDLRMIINVQLNDHRSAWQMDSDGNYTQRTPEKNDEVNSQNTLKKFAEQRLKAAAKHKQKKIRKKLNKMTR
ncbi:MAG: RNA degradosome polyphosphate kinase, partial [Thiotrichales bacterium]|nr:RNA degradosome polyphosphate kinase [Thiotrichales bacterium]MBT6809933.1 RNA degradosome polyphosphate kinase [Thiotrichales bacterium]